MCYVLYICHRKVVENPVMEDERFKTMKISVYETNQCNNLKENSDHSELTSKYKYLVPVQPTSLDRTKLSSLYLFTKEFILTGN